MPRIDKGNSAPVTATTPYDQQGARPKEKSSSSKEPATSRNRGDNSKGLKLGSISYARSCLRILTHISQCYIRLHVRQHRNPFLLDLQVGKFLLRSKKKYLIGDREQVKELLINFSPQDFFYCCCYFNVVSLQ